MKVWQVNDAGSFVDGVQLSSIQLKDLKLTDHDFMTVRVGVKADAANVGGVNIFGQRFGNYPQDILLRIDYL